MRNNNSLSSFSIAAVALLVAAVPCFAQSQSSESLAEVKNGLVAPGSGLELLFNSRSRATAASTGLLFVEPKKLVDTAHVVTSSTLSPAAFKVMSQFNAREKFSFDLRPSSYNSKKQFRTDDESGAEQSKRRFSFVPSRGPKMPS